VLGGFLDVASVLTLLLLVELLAELSVVGVSGSLSKGVGRECVILIGEGVTEVMESA
jgi:hypothetical protein